MSIPVEIRAVKEEALTSEQREEILQLQLKCFSDVTAQEAEEDFDRPRFGMVLAYAQGVLVACSELFKRAVEYEGKGITIGALGPCTREDMRGKGIGARVCKSGLEYLEAHECDIAFLSIGVEEGNEYQYHARLRFYERLGFALLDKPFTYANIRGEIKQSYGGLIAPLRSRELFEYVRKGKTQFTLRPEPGCF